MALEWFIDGMKAMLYIEHPQNLALGEGDAVPQYLLEKGIPMFFVLIFLEWLYIYGRDSSLTSKDNKLPGVRLNDAISSIISGSFQQISLLTFEIMGMNFECFFYNFVYDNMRITTIDSKQHVMFSYFCLMFGKDLGYYWAHRTFHEWHIMWVGHSVHHSGEDYNLACALRQGTLQPVVGWIFYTPLALLGFHPNAYSAHAQLNLLFMFLLHTDVIGRLPFGLEYIFNSPSAHRMHHRPPGNCNYAGMFIIWDRMFGTYEPEVERHDVYGLARQPNTFDSASLNVNHFNRMADVGGAGGGVASVFKSSFKRRVPANWVFDLRLLFKPIPPFKGDFRQVKGPRSRDKWDGAKPMTALWTFFVVASFLLSSSASVHLLLTWKDMHRLDAIASAIVVLVLFSAITRLTDMRISSTATSALLVLACFPTLFWLMTSHPSETYM